MNKAQPQIFSGKNLGLPGLICKYGMNAAGLIYAVLRPKETEKWKEQWVIGISLEHGILWQLTDLVGYPNELRIANNGNAYFSLADTIFEITPEGKVNQSINLKLEPHQEIGSFVLLDDGFLISIQGKKKPASVVMKTNPEGHTIWATNIPAGAIAYEGIVSMSVENNWEPRQSPAWTPQNWLCLDSNEILVSGHHALISYYEMPRSGIGISYQLDLITGKINWNTDPAPYQSICCFDDGSFLIGNQGYGAFESKLYDTNGVVTQQWPSVGEAVIYPENRVLLVEMDNGKSKLYYTELLPDNQVEIGPKVPGYYIVSPAIDEFGNMVFFRNNRLYIIGQDQTGISLLINKSEEVEYMIGMMSERVLLFNGLIIFSLNDTLHFFESNLGALADSPWPCKYGNLERNPVIAH